MLPDTAPLRKGHVTALQPSHQLVFIHNIFVLVAITSYHLFSISSAYPTAINVIDPEALVGVVVGCAYN